MYLHAAEIFPDGSMHDFYDPKVRRRFHDQTFHITEYFTALTYRKIKCESACKDDHDIWKIIVFFCPAPPVDGKFGCQTPPFCYKYYLDGLGVLQINAYFDFERYYAFENNVDKSKMITDAFEEELLKAFAEYGIEGEEAAKSAIQTIRDADYVFKTVRKTTLLSPTKEYKVFFQTNWKIDGIDFYVAVKKPRGRKYLWTSYLATIRSRYIDNSVLAFLNSCAWLSDYEFTTTGDIEGRKKIVDVRDGTVRDYEG